MSGLQKLQDLLGISNKCNLSIDIQEETEDKSNCSSESYSEDSFVEESSSNSEDEINELEETEDKSLKIDEKISKELNSLKDSYEKLKFFSLDVNENDLTSKNSKNMDWYKGLDLNNIYSTITNLFNYIFNSRESGIIVISADEIDKLFYENTLFDHNSKKRIKILLFLITIYFIHYANNCVGFEYCNPSYGIHSNRLRVENSDQQYIDLSISDSKIELKPSKFTKIVEKSNTDSCISISRFTKNHYQNGYFFSCMFKKQIQYHFGMKDKEIKDQLINAIKNNSEMKIDKKYLNNLIVYFHEHLAGKSYKHYMGNFLINYRNKGRNLEIVYHNSSNSESFADKAISSILTKVYDTYIEDIDFTDIYRIIVKLISDIRKIPTTFLYQFAANGSRNNLLNQEIKNKEDELSKLNQEIKNKEDKYKNVKFNRDREIENLEIKLKSIQSNIDYEVKNKEVKLNNLEYEMNKLEESYKTFRNFENFQINQFGLVWIHQSEYNKLKELESKEAQILLRSDELKNYEIFMNQFESLKEELLLKYKNINQKLYDYYSNEYNSKLKINENQFYQKNLKLEEEYKQKSEKLDKKLQKAINDANDKQKYWQNIIDHAEEHITSKLQKQLQEQINQFSKFNSTKWDSQVSFNIISTILRAINHKNDLIKLGIETNELEFKNLNEVLKCIQIFNMFGLCTNDKNENVLMNKFTFNFIDKINSYMKQFSVLDPDYKK